jgi:hypothetical protein
MARGDSGRVPWRFAICRDLSKIAPLAIAMAPYERGRG